jgi:hypothetical protein
MINFWHDFFDMFPSKHPMRTVEATSMAQKSLLISVLELKRLVIEIKDHGADICIRFRLMGQMWQQHFVRVVTVTENRVLVNDERANKLISVDLNNVMQFEIDNRYQNFEPNHHYEVTPFEI